MALHRQKELKTIPVQSQGAALKHMLEMDTIPTSVNTKLAPRSYTLEKKTKKKGK